MLSAQVVQERLAGHIEVRGDDEQLQVPAAHGRYTIDESSHIAPDCPGIRLGITPTPIDWMVWHMLVTIGIPFHNENPFHFTEAIRSVFAQEHRHWELILIGDGANERLVKLAKAIEDPRVRLVGHKRSAGLATRLNEIASLASGEFLFRMDADDMMHPSRVRIQAGLLAERHDVDFVASTAYTIDEDSRVVGLCRHREPPRTPAGFLWATPFVHPSVAGRRSWFQLHPYDEDLARCQDMDLWLSTAPGSTFAQVRKPLLYYRVASALTYEKYAKSSSSERKVIAKHGRDMVGRARTSALIARSFARQAAFGGMVMIGQGARLSRRRRESLSADALMASAEGLNTARTQFVPGWAESVDTRGR